MPRLVAEHFPNRYVPGFCVLDPEGLELAWETVRFLAGYRDPAYTPYELLIYFSTPGAARVGGLEREQSRKHLSSLFGNDSWEPIADAYDRHELPPGVAGMRYRQLYASQLESLGYRVIQRQVTTHSGTPMYHVLLATADDTGYKLLLETRSRAFLNNLPLAGFGS